MAQRVPELGEVAPEWQRHPALQEIGGPEQSLGRRERQDVGLLEVGMGGVHDQRDAGGDLVAELEREGVVTRFGVGQCRRGQLGFGRVVVEIDVGSPDDPPVQLSVLDLVLAKGEELGVQGKAEKAEEAEKRRERRERDKDVVRQPSQTLRKADSTYHRHATPF